MTDSSATATTSGDADALRGALIGRRVMLCLGSGGVGKTTTSAALALALARAGERVVVLTIDPARRLADALGLAGQLSNEPIRVATAGDGEVWAAMLDPAETFRRIVSSEAENEEQAKRILANRLFVNLTTTLSGTNEYMAAERLHQLSGDDRFDRVIVDTPPSHHVMDFLDSPARLTRFVDHRLYRSVLAPRHGLLRPLNAGAQMMMRLLGRLVGSSLVDDVVSFFADFEGMDQGFRSRAADLESLLTGPEAAYLLVTTPRADRLAEASWILDNLERRGHRVDGLIVNRVIPFATGSARDAPIDAGGDQPSAAASPLVVNLRQLESLARQEKMLMEPLRARLMGDRGQVPIVRVSEQLLPVRDLDGLRTIADAL